MAARNARATAVLSRDILESIAQGTSDKNILVFVAFYLTNSIKFSANALNSPTDMLELLLDYSVDEYNWRRKTWRKRLNK